MNTAAITARARTIKLSVVLLWLVTGVVYGPSWAAGRLWFCIVKATRWTGASIAEAFTAGAHPPGG